MKRNKGFILIEALLIGAFVAFLAAGVTKYDTTKKAEAQPTVQVAEQK